MIKVHAQELDQVMASVGEMETFEVPGVCSDCLRLTALLYADDPDCEGPEQEIATAFIVGFIAAQQVLRTHGLTPDEAKSLVLSQPEGVDDVRWSKLQAAAVDKLSSLVGDGQPVSAE